MDENTNLNETPATPEVPVASETPASSEPTSSFETPASSEPTSSFETPASSEPTSSFETPASSEPTSSFETPVSSEPTNSFETPASSEPIIDSNPYASTQTYSGTVTTDEAFSQGFAIASLILGIISIITVCCCAMLGTILGILGLVFGCLQKKNPATGKKPGIAIAGIICSSVGIGINILSSILGAIFSISDFM